MAINSYGYYQRPWLLSNMSYTARSKFRFITRMSKLTFELAEIFNYIRASPMQSMNCKVFGIQIHEFVVYGTLMSN